MLAPTAQNSLGLPIVLPGMPSISIRGIVTRGEREREREGEGEGERKRAPHSRDTHSVLILTTRLYPTQYKLHRILFSSRDSPKSRD